MKIVVAIDSLKGSLSSMEAGSCIKKGVLKAMDADVVVKPLADGGEGTVEALVTGMKGEYHTVEVMGPLMNTVSAAYGIIEKDKTAVIAMSEASGINLIEPSLRNPMNTTTYGVGQIILDAIRNGCNNFIIGIGGSATNDGGSGMLSALGFEFLDKNNEKISLGAKGLKDIAKIKTDNVVEELKNCKFKIACDVNNPLCGENGASYIYGPQKGADRAMVCELDKGLSHFADATKDLLGNDFRNAPGAGAAGGLGFAFISYLNGTLQSGIDIVLEAINLEDDIKDADIVVTGEGKLDAQTCMGKAPIGVAELAKKYNKNVVAFAGITNKESVECNKHGIDAYFSIVNRCMSVDDAMRKEVAEENMINTSEQVFRLVKMIGNK